MEKLVDMKPYEALIGFQPNINHLRRSRSIYFSKVLEKLRKNQDDQSQTMVIIGYHQTGSYTLYSPDDDKLVISRDVLVDESKGWK